MSGSGFLGRVPDYIRERIEASAEALAQHFRSAERADTLAYLERKKANAETMAARSPEFSDQGAWTARQISVLIDDLTAGIHVGEAEFAAHLAGKAA